MKAYHKVDSFIAIVFWTIAFKVVEQIRLYFNFFNQFRNQEIDEVCLLAQTTSISQLHFLSLHLAPCSSLLACDVIKSRLIFSTPHSGLLFLSLLLLMLLLTVLMGLALLAFMLLRWPVAHSTSKSRPTNICSLKSNVMSNVMFLLKCHSTLPSSDMQHLPRAAS